MPTDRRYNKNESLREKSVACSVLANPDQTHRLKPLRNTSLQLNTFIRQSRRATVNVACFLAFLFSTQSAIGQLTFAPNANVTLSKNVYLTVEMPVILDTGSVLTQLDSGTIYAHSDWQNNGGTMVPGLGRVLFLSGNASLHGTGTTNFFNVDIQKDTGATLSFDGNARIENRLNVLNGTAEFVHGGGSHVIDVRGNTLIMPTCSLTVASSGASQIHSLILGGNITNNGYFNLRPIANSPAYGAALRFNGSSTQTIDGSGTGWRLYSVDLDKGSIDSAVICFPSVSVSKVGFPNAMIFSNGTWHQVQNALRLDEGAGVSAQQSIGANGVLKLTGASTLEVGQEGAGGGLDIAGGLLLLNSSGTYSIGHAADNNLTYSGGAGVSPRLKMLTGELSIAGRLGRLTSDASTLDYFQQDGSVDVATAGHSSQLGTFDLTNTGSAFTVNSGTIEIHNRTSSITPTNADVSILADSIAVNGGTVTLGNSSTPLATVMDYDLAGSTTPATGLWNVAVGENVTLKPFAIATPFRLQNNLTVDGGFDSRTTRDGSATTTASLIFQGANSGNQQVSGNADTVHARRISMNRYGSGNGAVKLGVHTAIESELDLAEQPLGSSDQILALDSAISLALADNAVGAIAHSTGTVGSLSSPQRIIRTSNLSGSFSRGVADIAGSYLFPVGTISVSGINQFTPAVLNTRNAGSGTPGTVSVRVAHGSRADSGHLQLPLSATSFVKRYWSVGTSGSLDIDGAWDFGYVNDVVGSEAAINTVVRWRPSFEQSGGSWLNLKPAGATVNTTTDILSSPDLGAVGIPSNEFSGDWTAGNSSDFPQIFYSRVTGLWADNNTWSIFGHAGPAVASGIFPTEAIDSAIVGGGVLAVGNHEVTLDASQTIHGVALGSDPSNTGTLTFGTNSISGQSFTMGNRSILKTGHAQGLSASGATGSVQTTTRQFASDSRYIYNGATNQVTGLGLPNSVRNIFVQNMGAAGDNIVALSQNSFIDESLLIQEGAFDVGSLTISGGGSGFLRVDSAASLHIGGTGNMGSSTPSFFEYFLDSNSTVHFNGTNQTIAPAPNSGIGYGHVITDQLGSKTVDQAVLVRGNLTNQNGSLLHVLSNVNALTIEKSLLNSAPIVNEPGGIIILSKDE